MYSHMYDAVIITQFVNYSCHSLLVSEGFWQWDITLAEGDIGVCGIAVLDHFSCGISGILIPNCGVAVFSGPAGCGFSAFWAVLKIIVQVLLRFPSFLYLPIVSETSWHRISDILFETWSWLWSDQQFYRFSSQLQVVQTWHWALLTRGQKRSYKPTRFGKYSGESSWTRCNRLCCNILRRGEKRTELSQENQI